MGESVFTHMTGELLKEAFKDNDARKVTKEEYDTFIKDCVFYKLQGKKLGQAFVERFGIHDRVLSNYKEDINVFSHIKWCQYVER